MKDIKESISNRVGLTEFIQNSNEGMVTEGWREFFSAIKRKFKQAFEYLKSIVIKAGPYFIPVDNDGELQSCISPLTAGQAYKDGLINKKSTVVIMDKAGKRITGCNGKTSDAVKLYGSGNSIKYWEEGLRQIKENLEAEGKEFINEVKMHTEDPEAKYNIIVDNDELQDEIEYHLKHPKDAKLLIWGAPGIGKTAILLNVINKMQEVYPDFRMIVKTLSNETPDNFTLPKYIQVEGQDFATDIPKTWLPVYKPTGNSLTDQDLDAKCGRGLLFIDELSRATPQVLNVILPLVNEGMFNGYNLGSGWTIICASNRAEDEMSGQSSIGNALGNRFDQIYYEPTCHTWRQWADNQNFISPLLLQWLDMPETENMSGGKFFYMDPNESMDSISPTTLMCTPRSWTNAMRKLATYSDTGKLEGFSIFDIPKRIIGRVLNGYVPAQAVDAFLAFLSVIEKIGDFDTAVRGVWSRGSFKIGKRDLNLVALPLAQLIISAHSKKLPTTKEFNNLVKWLISTDSDQLASYVLDIFKKIFFDTLGPSEEWINTGFFIRQKRDDAECRKNWTIYKKHFAPLESKFKVNIDDDDFPDYYEGLVALSERYGADFESALVDGQEALG